MHKLYLYLHKTTVKENPLTPTEESAKVTI